ncbi:MAG: YihY/virulence factor BrkB family protein [Sphingomonas bacterium]
MMALVAKLIKLVRKGRWWIARQAVPPRRAAVPTGRIDAPRLALQDLLGASVRTVRHAVRQDYGMAASAIAFSSFLSLLPMLAMIILTYGQFIAAERVLADVRSLISLLPDDVRRFVNGWLIETITRREGQGWTLLLSTIVTIYSATRAGRSVIGGLNLATGVVVPRKFLAKRLAAIGIVLFGAALMLMALFLTSALAFAKRYAPQLLAGAASIWTVMLWVALALAASGVTALIYRHVPARQPPGWRQVATGSIFATAAWIFTTAAFGLYLGSFGTYHQTYGSIGAIVALQLWLFLSAMILLIGARLNVEVEALFRQRTWRQA